ncbi:proline--tRNA ligase [Candidatus Falkowbacteria bacterium CG_4_10_14_0_2_um_filter_36_22]|uniref:Proline--tRNA ligase n=1 Tax=Candidatus Falkowbacteria bacterium CG02_land_8_20_14_3_00_36_14 TaxID=1974560 RepID=A0A2M7DQI6_9BACT|nr:MAG: proline--tRNA ligase [Candidatus Falkowbacteria bacterium CG02_land_8_20_14_3_00_36_14]PIX11904.1 MAG: proline--tRNA ligase [Candidatus Falkowbacteria bacterium CG_4_8_14_3_um_filter_36_11]PJA10655.1 MAG: proline--tRNA ligase [Candidatus Falkowbacteria bacterium CG_4_10_14_0_2_um_filter_36_22]
MKKITKRSENYSEWYLDIIAGADLAEHAPVRGCMIIKPYGYAIWEKMVGILDNMIKGKGVANAYFPLFIPESFLKREAEHVKGFSPELAVVTHGGGKKLEEPLAIRPTSETIIYEAFSRWIQSYRDLPLVINQWANVVRWEMRPRLFLRTTEFLWQEGHTAHATLEEAEKYALMILKDIYEHFAEKYLAMPVHMGQKSEGEKFAGALKTYCIEALMQDGKSLQAGTSHNLGDHFAKSFKVKYFNKDGQTQYACQTSWGVSTRLIGGLIMSHSDDKGLVLPPLIAPIQVIIIPIAREESDPVFKEAKKMQVELSSIYSAKLDERLDLRPGEKYYEWERKGIPIRVEIGPRDLEKNQAVIVRRDTGAKENCQINLLRERVKKLLEEIQANLFATALKRRQENSQNADTWEEFYNAIKRGGYVFSHWCGDETCEAQIKEKVKAVSRCLPLNGTEENGEHYCVHCGKKTSYQKRWIFASAY